MAQLSSLKPNEKNPRKISEARLAVLKRALSEFGDLSGFVYNRNTKRLISGHQRQKILPPDSEIVIERKFKKPTKTGTLAEGYIESGGERFSYREVSFDEIKEKQATIAANRGGGDWDDEILAEMFQDLSDFGADLDLTLFDEGERNEIFNPELNHDFMPGSEKDQSKLDEKKKAICPHCGEEFTVAGRQ